MLTLPEQPEPGPALEPKQQPHISFSQVDKYRRCSLAWYFRYVLHWDERPSLNLARGKAGHHAVEVDQRTKMQTGFNVTRERLLDEFSDAFDGFTHDITPADLSPSEDIGKSKDATVHSLTYFSVKTAPALNPRLVEWQFNLLYPPSEYYEEPLQIVNGRIDLLDASAVLDAKFPARRDVPSQDKVDMSWQLTLYDEAFSRQLGIEVPNLGLMTFLPPNTKDGARVEFTMRSPTEMAPARREARRARLEHVLRDTQARMKAGFYAPADDPMVCARCEFRDRCQSSLVRDDFTAIQMLQKGG